MLDYNRLNMTDINLLEEPNNQDIVDAFEKWHQVKDRIKVCLDPAILQCNRCSDKITTRTPGLFAHTSSNSSNMEYYLCYPCVR